MIVDSSHTDRENTASISREYTFLPPVLVGNDVHITAARHSDHAIRHKHTSTESHHYTDMTQIVYNPYKQKVTDTEKNLFKHKTQKLITDGT